MSRLEVVFVHLATLLVGGTGLVYAVMRYLLEPEDDPLGIVNHPLEPTVQHLHVLLAPLLVFAVGIIWRRHVWASWRSGFPERRLSGLGLILTMAPMVVSGYLVQVAVSEGWRTVWVAVHATASALWIIGYGVHVIVRQSAPVAARPAGER